MKPPICVVCGKFANNDPAAGMVQFALSAEEEKFNEKFKEPGFVGHPIGLEWFCGVHKFQAQDLRDLRASDAIEKLNNSL